MRYLLSVLCFHLPSPCPTYAAALVSTAAAAEQTDLSMGRCLQRQSVPWKANQEVEEVLSGTGVRQVNSCY